MKEIRRVAVTARSVLVGLLLALASCGPRGALDLGYDASSEAGREAASEAPNASPDADETFPCGIPEVMAHCRVGVDFCAFVNWPVGPRELSVTCLPLPAGCQTCACLHAAAMPASVYCGLDTYTCWVGDTETVDDVISDIGRATVECVQP
jgi:hypothetical protein